MAKIAQIIKYEGDNNTLIWKHPCEDFNALTQLIVHESQEAVFFMNGQALDLFGPGRHTLETQNTPRIGKFLNRATDGDTPFHCEVYFINKTVQMAINWGTDSKVRFLDPSVGFPVEIGASGKLNLAVCDSRKLLLKLVGTMKGIAWGNGGYGFTQSVQDSFRPLIQTAVKEKLAVAIKEGKINLLEIDSKLGVLSEHLRISILPGFEEYGLTIPQFYVMHVLLPDNDPNFRRWKDLHAVSLETKTIQADAQIKSVRAQAEAAVIEAQRKAELERQLTATEIAKREAERDLIRAETQAQAAKKAGFAEAEVMRAKGYTEKDVLQADVQKAYAEGIGNMTITGGGGSSVAGDMLGISLGMAAAGAVAPQVGDMFKGFTPAAQAAPTAKCAKCGAALPDHAKFCPECGEKVASVVAETIVCPACGKTVAKGKFCPECGQKLAVVCPKCGKDVVVGAKFCLECGEKL